MKKSKIEVINNRNGRPRIQETTIGGEVAVYTLEQWREKQEAEAAKKSKKVVTESKTVSKKDVKLPELDETKVGAGKKCKPKGKGKGKAKK